MSYPHCEARGVLIQTKAGPRASLSGLYATMTPDEWGKWFRRSEQDPPIDDFGAAVEPVEAFLSQFPLPSNPINMIVDFAEESMEWNDQQHVYPLGVVYVGEAVCDFAPPEPIDCDCEACTQGHNSLLIARQMSDLRSVVRSQWWCVAGALVLIGVVALCV